MLTPNWPEPSNLQGVVYRQFVNVVGTSGAGVVAWFPVIRNVLRVGVRQERSGVRVVGAGRKVFATYGPDYRDRGRRSSAKRRTVYVVVSAGLCSCTWRCRLVYIFGVVV